MAKGIAMEEKKERKELRKTIRFSKKELEEITQRANNLHMSFSEYILYSALNKKISTKKTPLYKELITELAKQGNNLNQIAKICNTDKIINTTIASRLVVVISELQSQLSEIYKKL